MTKIKDVAAYLGVSPSTVSRVLNGYDGIAPETRLRVEEAIRKLNYQPDELARRMKQDTVPIIGIIVPDITNPFFSNLARGAQRAADEAGYTVLMCDTNNNPKLEERSVSLLTRYRAAGIISASILSESQTNEIYGSHDDVVFVDNIPMLKHDFSSVTINNYLATSSLIQCLIDKGYRKFCAIAGPVNESSATERLRGYQDTLIANGIPVLEESIRYGNNDICSGQLQMKKILESNYRPEVVFAANNFMSYGAASAITQAGLALPDDIAIATFDVFDNTGLIKNQFCYVEQPASEIGYVAANTCIARDRDGDQNCCKHILKYTICE